MFMRAVYDIVIAIVPSNYLCIVGGDGERVNCAAATTAVKVRRARERGASEKKKKKHGKKFGSRTRRATREWDGHRVKIGETDTLGRLSGRARDPVNISFMLLYTHTHTVYTVHSGRIVDLHNMFSAPSHPLADGACVS